MVILLVMVPGGSAALPEPVDAMVETPEFLCFTFVGVPPWGYCLLQAWWKAEVAGQTVFGGLVCGVVAGKYTPTLPYAFDSCAIINYSRGDVQGNRDDTMIFCLIGAFFAVAWQMALSDCTSAITYDGITEYVRVRCVVFGPGAFLQCSREGTP